jgi:hypothetical protein
MHYFFRYSVLLLYFTSLNDEPYVVIRLFFTFFIFNYLKICYSHVYYLMNWALADLLGAMKIEVYNELGYYVLE